MTLTEKINFLVEQRPALIVGVLRYTEPERIGFNFLRQEESPKGPYMVCFGSFLAGQDELLEVELAFTHLGLSLLQENDYVFRGENIDTETRQHILNNCCPLEWQRAFADADPSVIERFVVVDMTKTQVFA